MLPLPGGVVGGEFFDEEVFGAGAEYAAGARDVVREVARGAGAVVKRRQRGRVGGGGGGGDAGWGGEAFTRKGTTERPSGGGRGVVGSGLAGGRRSCR